MKRTPAKEPKYPRFLFLGLELWVWGARGEEERSPVLEELWKIPRMFIFSFLLLARDILNSHLLHHARNWYKNTHMLGQHRTIRRGEGGLCMFYNKRLQLLSFKSTSTSSRHQIEKPVWGQFALWTCTTVAAKKNIFSVNLTFHLIYEEAPLLVWDCFLHITTSHWISILYSDDTNPFLPKIIYLWRQTSHFHKTCAQNSNLSLKLNECGKQYSFTDSSLFSLKQFLQFFKIPRPYFRTYSTNHYSFSPSRLQ